VIQKRHRFATIRAEANQRSLAANNCASAFLLVPDFVSEAATMSGAVINEISQLLLAGWTMLPSSCPNDGCNVRMLTPTPMRDDCSH